MRKGTNPEKSKTTIEIEHYHRVIVPVYIPHFNGYFEQLLDIFQLCLESLLLTSHAKTRITIYNNNSHPDVKNYIDSMYQKNEMIDQVFHSKENLGKINAYLTATKGNIEPLITITDADVLFKNGWQEAVESLFIGFPEAGMISPVPLSNTPWTFTANNWFYALFKGKLKFEKVLDPEAMSRFYVSLDNDKPLYNKTHLEKYLVLKNKKSSAVMGCGHFVATLKREVIDLGTNKPSFHKIDSNIENLYIDAPNEALGFLRLATKNNYAYHMGNQTEPWMYEEFKSIKKNTFAGVNIKQIGNTKIGKFGNLIGRVIIKLLRVKIIKKNVLIYLGMKKGINY